VRALLVRADGSALPEDGGVAEEAAAAAAAAAREQEQLLLPPLQEPEPAPPMPAKPISGFCSGGVQQGTLSEASVDSHSSLAMAVGGAVGGAGEGACEGAGEGAGEGAKRGGEGDSAASVAKLQRIEDE
jgi:hypothetical protein